jgi:hypothetical protein
MVEQVHSGFVSNIVFGPAMANAVRRLERLRSRDRPNSQQHLCKMAEAQ